MTEIERIIEKHALEPMTGVKLIDFNKKDLAKAIEKYILDMDMLSLCPHCNCMTKKVCGKCKKIKDK